MLIWIEPTNFRLVGWLGFDWAALRQFAVALHGSQPEGWRASGVVRFRKRKHVLWFPRGRAESGVRFLSPTGGRSVRRGQRKRRSLSRNRDDGQNNLERVAPCTFSRTRKQNARFCPIVSGRVICFGGGRSPISIYRRGESANRDRKAQSSRIDCKLLSIRRLQRIVDSLSIRVFPAPTSPFKKILGIEVFKRISSCVNAAT